MATLTLENGKKIELELELGTDGIVAVRATSKPLGSRYLLEFRPDGTLYRNMATLPDFRLTDDDRIVDVTEQGEANGQV